LPGFVASPGHWRAEDGGLRAVRSRVRVVVVDVLQSDLSRILEVMSDRHLAQPVTATCTGMTMPADQE
jgi:hypothetical protein